MGRDYRKQGFEGKTHYKLYKSGRNWVVAGMTVFSLGLGLAVSQTDQAKAATQSSESVSSSASSTTSESVALKGSSTTASSANSSSTSESDASSTTESETKVTNATQTSQPDGAANDVKTGSDAASGSQVATASSTTQKQSETPDTGEDETNTGQTDATAETSSSTTTPTVNQTASKDSDGTTASKPTDSAATSEPITVGTSNSKAAVTQLTAAVPARESLLRESTTAKSIEYATTGALTFKYGELTDFTQLASAISMSSPVDSTTPDVVLYAKDASGNYLVDADGNKVNLMYELLPYATVGEDESSDFSVVYTNVAGELEDVSLTSGQPLDAGTYTLTLTSTGEATLASLASQGYLTDYTFDADTDVNSYWPTTDEFTGTYSFQVVITPKTLIPNTSATASNSITISSTFQEYNGELFDPLPAVVVHGDNKQVVFRTGNAQSTSGKVTTSLDGVAANGTLVFTDDDFDYTYLSGTNLTGHDVGTYTITLNAAGIAALRTALGQNFVFSGYNDDGSYAITGTGTITKAKSTVTTSSATVTYNGTAQGTTVTATNDYDNLDFTTATGTAVNSSTNNPDGYLMTAELKDANQAAILAKNYNVTESDGTLVIDPAPLTVTTVDNTVTYDGKSHGTTSSVTAGNNYDNLDFTTVAKSDGTTTAYTDAGNYVMTGTTSDATDNYQITYVTGTLTIKQALATITIPSQTYWADKTVKNLTATVTGTVNGETLTYTLTDGLQAVGTKEITATVDSTDPVNKNYVVTVNPGTLTVGDVTVAYEYGYLDADGNLVVTTTTTGQASHGDDPTASDYLVYTTTSEPKMGYTQASDNTGLAANGTLSGTGGVVKYVYLANDESVNVVYYDKTTGQPITTVVVSGKYGTTDTSTTATLADYEKQGYKVDSSTIPADGIAFTTDGEVPTYTVNLVHNIASITDTKVITQTIHYQNQQGQTIHPDTTRTVTFTRSGETDQVTNDTTYGEWTSTDQTTFAALTAPVIAGYRATTTATTPVTVEETSPDDEQTLVYQQVATPQGPQTTPEQPTTSVPTPGTQTNPALPGKTTQPAQVGKQAAKVTTLKPEHPVMPVTVNGGLSALVNAKTPRKQAIQPTRSKSHGKAQVVNLHETSTPSTNAAGVTKPQASQTQPEKTTGQTAVLPQTNDNRQTSLLAAVLGWLLATLSVGVRFISRKRHE